MEVDQCRLEIGEDLASRIAERLLDGTLVAVTEKTSNTIVVYSIAGGRLVGPFIGASAGQEPFGFAFGPHNLLFVSEAFNGAAEIAMPSVVTEP